jgi:hypothetical protein
MQATRLIHPECASLFGPLFAARKEGKAIDLKKIFPCNFVATLFPCSEERVSQPGRVHNEGKVGAMSLLHQLKNALTLFPAYHQTES